MLQVFTSLHIAFHINGMEVALNFVSGRGKEHMALVSAVLKLGLGVRFIALKPGGIEEI